MTLDERLALMAAEAKEKEAALKAARAAREAEERPENHYLPTCETPTQSPQLFPMIIRFDDLT